MQTRSRGLMVSAMALALAAGAATADEMAEYKSFFEPLPFLPPIPAHNSMTPEKIDLGRMLFLNRAFRVRV